MTPNQPDSSLSAEEETTSTVHACPQPIHGHHFVPYPLQTTENWSAQFPSSRRIYCETCGEVRKLDPDATTHEKEPHP